MLGVIRDLNMCMHRRWKHCVSVTYRTTCDFVSSRMGAIGRASGCCATPRLLSPTRVLFFGLNHRERYICEQTILPVYVSYPTLYFGERSEWS